MTEIAFYHLERWPLEHALPKLLEKTLALKKRALVIVGSDARMIDLDGRLWTYSPASWLPHATRHDEAPDEQPILLSTDGQNANGAGFLFLVDGATTETANAFERCFDLFDGNDPQAVVAARQRWRACLAAGHGLTYWR